MKQILLFVAGMTPQIITETLWALNQQRHETVDEIRVITTLEGLEKIERCLLHPEDGKFYQYCRDYGIEPATIAFNRTTISVLQKPDRFPLDDIRTELDNEWAANQICEIVNELTRDSEVKIHACAAGGRKTMSIFLTAAMQLFGRVQDRVSHVLVSEDFETNSSFYYIPPPERHYTIRTRDNREVSTATARIHLADIPFIRLRGVLSGFLATTCRSYSELVEQTQVNLGLLESAHALHMDVKRNTVTVAGRSVRLTEKEFFIYALFAEKRRLGQANATMEEITSEEVKALFWRVTTARGEAQTVNDYVSARFNYVKILAEQCASSRTVDRDNLKKNLIEVFSKIKKKFENADIPRQYFISANGEDGTIRYGIRIAPELINWK